LRIGVIGDLHGIYPDTSNWPKLDLLLLGGDLFSDYRKSLYEVIAIQETELLEKFNPWLEGINLPKKRKLFIGGNHDHILQHYQKQAQEKVSATYLENSFVVVDGFKIWGTPYSFFPPKYPKPWSFGSSEEGLKILYESIPKDVDIVMSHTPAKGALDLGFGGSHMGMFNFGSVALKEFLDQNPFPLPKLKLFTVNHVHEHGTSQMDWTWWDAKEERRRKFKYVNAAADIIYNPTQALTLVYI
jgi:hypothetical protein